MSNRRPRDLIGRRVRTFYEGCSFPGYEDFDSPFELIEKARKGIYARVVDEQLPLRARILDAGCGTGQLAIFLSVTRKKVFGIDFSYASLDKGNAFKKKFGIKTVSFAQMDLFYPALKEKAFDYVFCNGVLHHTADAYGAFQDLCGLVKPGGYITIGLYNPYGRLLLNMRRRLFSLTGDRLTHLDFYMRQKSLGEDKKRIWFVDQYKNPYEQEFSVGKVLDWFEKNNIEYINSIPKIRLGDQFAPTDRLFEPHSPGNFLDRFLCQLGWLFTQSREGGFFVTIGRRRR